MIGHQDEREVLIGVLVATLSSSNYFMWSTDLEIYLLRMGLWNYVKYDAPSSGSSEALDIVSVRKRDMALIYIVMLTRGSCKNAFMIFRHPHEAWLQLENPYHSPSEASIDARLTRLQVTQTIRNDSDIVY